MTTPSTDITHRQPPPIPAFLIRDTPEKPVPAARPRDPYKAECRRARQIARECRRLLARDAKRKAAARKRRKTRRRKS